MQFEQIQLNAPHLSLWLNEDKGLVFHQGQKELSQIDPISIALLMALDEGLTDEQTLIELLQHSNLTKQQLKPSLEQVKKLFKNTQEQHTYADGLYAELQNHIMQQPKQHSFYIKVANATFAITSNDEELLVNIKSLLAPIQITTPNEVDFAICIEIYKGNYLLVSNDIVVEEGLTQQQVMPVFIDRLQILAYQHSDYCFGFHGAALTKEMDPCIGSGILLRSTSSIHGVVREDDDGGVPSHSSLVSNPCITILLPGVSGAGKSTLTAELSKQNYSVYSDEIIALDNTFNLTTLALPMAIKSGSWSHIAELYPEINSQPEWHRVDGRILKYIWPEQIAEEIKVDLRIREDDGKERHSQTSNSHSQTSNSHSQTSNSHSQAPQRHSQAPQRHSVLVTESTSAARSTGNNNKTLLISPSYNKSVTPKATKLSVIDTIALVTNGGYQLGIELTEQRVEQLIQYCEQISAYHISYASSKQAQQLIEQLCQK